MTRCEENMKLTNKKVLNNESIEKSIEITTSELDDLFTSDIQDNTGILDYILNTYFK